MKEVRALILRTAGTNCDLETEYAFVRAGAAAKRVHVEELMEGSEQLADHHIFVIPGGFSYGDDIAAGRVLANELRARLGDQIEAFLESGGLALGICNGFQALVKMGWLPRRVPSPAEQSFSLVDNDSGRFEDRWVRLKVRPGRCVFVKEEETIELPVAHGEGKFVARENALIDELFEAGQVVFSYVGPDGGEAGYPANPNGSYRGVAGVCDETGRILGMMPHPERFVSPWSHPRHTREGLKPEGDGLRIFRNAVEHVRRNVL